MSQLSQAVMKVPPLVIALAYGGYVAYSAYSFTSSPDSPLVQQQTQLKQAETNLAAARAKLDSLKAFYAALDQKRSEVRKLALQLNQLKIMIPDKISLPDTQKLILTEAKRTGLSVQSWSQEPPKVLPDYTEQTFTMNAKGLFFRYLIFLDRITSASRILKVKDVDFSPQGPVSPKIRYVELGSKIEITAYSYNQTQADSAAQKQATPGQQQAAPPPGGAPAAPAKGAGT